MEPLEDVSPVEGNNNSWLNKWLECSPSVVQNFTGVGYFFGRDLFEKLHVPIGLISVSWGGTTAEAWMPNDAFENDPDLKLILSNWPDYNNDEEWLKQEYAKYVQAIEKARTEGKEIPLYFNQPSVLFNGILAPIIPFGIRGVTWYQGESNAYRAYQYRNLFPALIQSWRDKWEQGNFPFLFVQLANYHFEPQVFPELREAQSKALSLPETAMTVAIDIGDSADIHPKNKQEVGRRLSLAARKLAYDEELIYSGPVYQSMIVTGNKCILSFEQTGEGLVAKGSGTLLNFVIAGEDRIFTKASAMIMGNKIFVWSDSIVNPVAVRYAWANHPGGCNLCNKLNEKSYLPASPFRTDDWPGITAGRK
jgi:sialate O-acetylesterase